MASKKGTRRRSGWHKRLKPVGHEAEVTLRDIKQPAVPEYGRILQRCGGGFRVLRKSASY